MPKNSGELSVKDSIKIVKNFIKKRRHIRYDEIKPGVILFTQYTAKYKELVYDRTPLVLVLRRGATHTLGLNFHWVPYKMRITLIRAIMRVNKTNIKEQKPLKFEYKKIKTFLKKRGYVPCVRLYINKRFTLNGLIIPSTQLLEVAKLNTATFTKGVPAETMYNLARQKKI